MFDENGLLGVETLAVFVGVDALVNTGSSAVLDFSFAAAGDLGFIHAYMPLVGADDTTASGWTRATYTWDPINSYTAVVMWKVLDADDIADGVSVTGIGVTADRAVIGWAAYRGATSAALIDGETAYSSATITLAGFTPSADSVGVVTVLHRRVDTVNPTPPAGATRRHSTTVESFGTAALADICEPDSYDGSALTWSGLVAVDGQAALVIELRE